MKRSERHHLKENPLAHTLARASDVMTTRGREIGYAIVGILVLAAVIGGYVIWRGRIEASAGALLAAALTIAEAPVAPPATPPQPGATPQAPPPGSYPTEQAKLEAAVPKFLDVAARYPSTDAGLTARYHAACALAELGRSAEAQTRYQEVIDRDGNGIYGQMARLGLANLEVAGGQFDRAITIYKELTADRETRLPVDGILMQLGHAYARAGKTADAKQTFTRIVDEFPQSLYAPQAKQELAKL
ncbi:MAG: tetratricopeptide repeat protein [Vicinamibacterales bacterium]